MRMVIERTKSPSWLLASCVKLGLIVVATLVAGRAGFLTAIVALIGGWICVRRPTIISAEQFVLVDHWGRHLACLGSTIPRENDPLYVVVVGRATAR